MIDSWFGYSISLWMGCSWRGPLVPFWPDFMHHWLQVPVPFICFVITLVPSFETAAV